MAKSKLIRDLINREIDEAMCIERIYLIGLELKAIEICDWCRKELSGYKKEDVFPAYRELGPGHIVYSGINGSVSFENHSLPLSLLAKHLDKISEMGKLTLGIRTIIQNVSSTTASVSFDLSHYIEEIQKTGIYCSSIRMIYSNIIFSEALGAIRTVLIESLVLLESAFGSLDNFDLDYNDITPTQIQEVTQHVTDILYADGRAFR